MSKMFRLHFMVVCACFVFSARVFAAETNPVVSTQTPDTTTQSLANGFLLIQEQLHATQLAIENNRQEAEAAARRTDDEMAARIQTLEQTIATQHANDTAAAQKIEQFTLLMAGIFGLVCIAVLLLMAYLQWRAVTRLVALIAPQSATLRPLPAVATDAAVAQSNARLFGTVDLLEKRILELEQMARSSLAKKNPPTASEHQNGSVVANDDRTECVANLLVEGHKLIEAGAPEKALECFDMALAIQPRHAEALVKKAGALEKLDKLDEAVACYDRAIEADNSLAIAYLQKGGLFNRLARYDEALQCYEQALRTQEKNASREKVAA
jgi:tetratricopeptide (TPR) repeat protein